MAGISNIFFGGRSSTLLNIAVYREQQSVECLITVSPAKADAKRRQVEDIGWKYFPVVATRVMSRRRRFAHSYISGFCIMILSF